MEQADPEIGMCRREGGLNGERTSKETPRPHELAALDQNPRGIGSCGRISGRDGKDPEIAYERRSPGRMSHQTLKKQRVDLGGRSGKTPFESDGGGREAPTLDISDDVRQLDTQAKISPPEGPAL